MFLTYYLLGENDGMRKRICVLLAQLEEKTQNRFMTAFTKEAYAHDYDICIFSMYQKFQETDLRNIGDSNIFSLANFDKFDGLVVLLDTILTPGFEEKLLKRIKEDFHGPVVIIDRESKDFDYILVDHYTPCLKIMNHLLDVHGYKDIAFLGGKEGHPHSVQRFKAYEDAMKAHDIPIREDRIFHGDYWYRSGIAFAEKLLEKKDDLPEAVMCANEHMAIGLASVFSKNGYNIPGDIAIAAYDTTNEGQTSPVPITSAEIPADTCGKLCFAKLHSKITGEELREPELDYQILIGGSCGCQDFKEVFKRVNRDDWATDYSEESYRSDFNHITEDLLCQTHYDKFFEMLAVYSYQIRPFKSFKICLNDGFRESYSFIGPNARREGYSEKVHMVINCNDKLDVDKKEAVNFDASFDSLLMLPELYEERDYPTTFIFTPLFFEDRSFGYAVLNYGDEIRYYTEDFRAWMKNVNQGLEAFFRQKALFFLIDQIKSQQVRDTQTGLYNYQGFIDTFTPIVENNINKNRSLAIIAIDINNLTKINEDHNRLIGDLAILAVSRFISRHTKEHEVCARLSNDEFLIGMVGIECEKRYEEFVADIPKRGITFHDSDNEEHKVHIHHKMNMIPIKSMPDLDVFINQTVNEKNHQKKLKMQKEFVLSEMTNDELDKVKTVEKILDNDLLSYYFQPIVKVSDGEIFGYEALMRYEDDLSLTPLEIIKCAGALNRLYDIEKLSFNGVIDRMEETPERFISKKVFINSLPAYQLQGEDEDQLFTRLKRHLGRIVVEYTEDSEFNDEQLKKRKNDYLSLYIEIALDDYGSGYSNVNNLIRYNPRYVKIDHGLIRGINSNSQKRHFVKNIVSYASKSNIQVLAEGVETEEELRTVIGIGVNLIQGFYTGRPGKEPVQKIDDEIRSKIRRFSYGSVSSIIPGEENN